MTVNEARNAVMSRFNALWNNETPIAWDNLDYSSNVEEFVRISMQHNTGSQVGLGPVGDRLFRKSGLIYVQVFTNLKTGASRSDILAEKAWDIFLDNAGLVWFINQRINHIGRDSEGKFYQQNVSAEFIYDSIR